MKRPENLFFIVALLFTFLRAYPHNHDSIASSSILFTENKSQWQEEILFKAQLSNANLYLHSNSITYDLVDPEYWQSVTDFKSNRREYKKLGKVFPDKIKKHAYKLNFLNSNQNTKIEGNNPERWKYNYFVGNETEKWASNVNNYREVNYENLYENIDLRLYSSEDSYLKYDFILKAFANPDNIKIKYEGVNSIKLIKGNLIISTDVQKITELKPYAYFIENGEEIEVKCDFVLSEYNILQYKLEKYDNSKEIIIDPVVVFSTYSGSTADNWGYTATYDSEGFLYAGGIAFNTGGSYPTTLGAYSQSFAGGQCDIVISKYDTTGSFMVYSTYLGGSEAEVPASLVVNSNNELFILAVTSSTNFPTTASAVNTSFNGGNSVMPSFSVNFQNGSDLAISKLSTNGSSLLASTYFGGSGNDGMNNNTSLRKNYADEIRGEIIIDKHDNCIVASSTHSTDIPVTTNAFQQSNSGSQEGLVFKMDNNLSTLIWASYIGGSGADAVYNLSLDSHHDIYITGGTTSSNFPITSNALFSTYQGGISDGFIAKIRNNGNAIMHSTYFGTPTYDQSYFIDNDRNDNVYIFGQTNNANSILIQNAQWNNPLGGQFITKLTPNLSTIVWSTKWGTNNAGVDVSPSAFMVDLCNRVYLTAWGGSTNVFGTTNGLPITGNAAQTTTDGSDYYLLVMNDDASALDYATFYGGSVSHEHVDGGTSRFDKTGHVYQSVCAGCGNGGSSDFPTTTGCNSSTNNSSNCNNAVFKFDFDVPVILAEFQQPTVLCAPATINFNNNSFEGGSSASYSWDFDDGTGSTLKNPSHTYSNSGIYNVQLIISDATSCNLSDTIIKQVVVLDDKTDTLPAKKICKGDYTQIGITPLNDPSVSYTWSPAFNLSSTNVSNPIANPPSSIYYKLLVSNGVCTDTLLQRVIVYDIDANAGNDTTMCDTLITLTANTNYKDLNFQWSSNSNFTDTLNNNLLDSTLTISVLNPTYYYVKIYWDNCYSIDSVLVDKRIKLSELNTNPLCYGDSNGVINITANGGNTPYTFTWNNGSSGANITNLKGGTYTVTVKDQDNCFAQKTITLIDPDLLESNASSLNIPCEDACIGKAFANAIGGTPPYSYSWNDPSNQQSSPATQLCEGTYIVTISDSNNCITKDTIEIIDSSVYMTFNAWIEGGKDSIYEGQNLQFMSNYFGTAYNYNWTPTQGLSNPYTYDPIASPNSTTTYYVTVSDQYGCSWMDSITVYVTDVICEEPYIFVPNSFSPNGDGMNDAIYVRSNVIYEVDFSIYNRWGELVFQTNDLNEGWDGYYKGKLSEPGVFVYYLNVTCYNKEIFKKKGNITLIR